MEINPKLRAMLDLIAFSEGTSTHPLTRNNGYDVLVSGIHGPSVFTDYSKHPFEGGGSVVVRTGPPELISTAAGRYQLLARFWKVYKVQLHLADYSPAFQDAVAIQQIGEGKALALIEAGNIEGAIAACSNIWASFPCNDYGQGGHSMQTLVAKYQELLTVASGDSQRR
jgi:muramidase (phage lysozyme)